MKKLLILLVFLTGCANQYIAHVDGNLYRGSRQVEFGKLNQFDKVINLETYVVPLDNSLGDKLVHIPMSEWVRPTKEKLQRIVDEIERTNGTVLVHCRRGADRTGYAVMAYRILHNGWTVDEAYKEARKYNHAVSLYQHWKPVLYEIGGEQ